MGDGAVVSAKFSPPNMAPAPRPTKILKLREGTVGTWDVATGDDALKEKKRDPKNSLPSNGGGF